MKSFQVLLALGLVVGTKAPPTIVELIHYPESSPETCIIHKTLGNDEYTIQGKNPDGQILYTIALSDLCVIRPRTNCLGSFIAAADPELQTKMGIELGAILNGVALIEQDTRFSGPEARRDHVLQEFLQWIALVSDRNLDRFLDGIVEGAISPLNKICDIKEIRRYLSACSPIGYSILEHEVAMSARIPFYAALASLSLNQQLKMRGLAIRDPSSGEKIYCTPNRLIIDFDYGENSSQPTTGERLASFAKMAALLSNILNNDEQNRFVQYVMNQLGVEGAQRDEAQAAILNALSQNAPAA